MHCVSGRGAIVHVTRQLIAPLKTPAVTLMLIEAKGNKNIQPLNLICLFVTLGPRFLLFYLSAFNYLYCIVLTIRLYCVIMHRVALCAPAPPSSDTLFSLFYSPPEGLSRSRQNHGAIYIPQCFLRLPFSLLSSEGHILCSL